MKKSILIFLADKNFNEIEFKTVKRVLENAGIQVFISSDTQTVCKGENGLKVKPDVILYNINKSNFSGLVIIGGNGIKDYWSHSRLHQIVKDFYNNKKLVAAICSAPIILAEAGILNGKKAVCYQKDKHYLERSKIEFIDVPVIIEENVITAKDFNSADEFVLAILDNIS
jgi:protease I